MSMRKSANLIKKPTEIDGSDANELKSLADLSQRAAARLIIFVFDPENFKN